MLVVCVLKTRKPIYKCNFRRKHDYMRHLGMVHDKVLVDNISFLTIIKMFNFTLLHFSTFSKFFVQGDCLLAGGDAGVAEEVNHHHQHQHQEEGWGWGGAEMCQEQNLKNCVDRCAFWNLEIYLQIITYPSLLSIVRIWSESRYLPSLNRNFGNLWSKFAKWKWESVGLQANNLLLRWGVVCCGLQQVLW